MTRSALWVTASAIWLLAPAAGNDANREAYDRPRIDRVEPGAARAGGLVTIYGQSLDRSAVADVLLSDGDCVALTRILDQSATRIRVRLPRMLEPGKYSILLVTRGREPKFIDQGFTVKVE